MEKTDQIIHLMYHHGYTHRSIRDVIETQFHIPLDKQYIYTRCALLNLNVSELDREQLFDYQPIIDYMSENSDKLTVLQISKDFNLSQMTVHRLTRVTEIPIKSIKRTKAEKEVSEIFYLKIYNILKGHKGTLREKCVFLERLKQRTITGRFHWNPGSLSYILSKAEEIVNGRK